MLHVPHTRLNREDEYQLAKRVRDGDEKALHALVLSHVSFAVSMARRYEHIGLGRDDLYAEACLGLIQAARRFDPEAGVRFITYAKWWVRACLIEYLEKNRRAVAAPQSRLMRKLRHYLHTAERDLENKTQGAVGQEELAQSLDVDVQDVCMVQHFFLNQDVPLMSSDFSAGEGTSSNGSSQPLSPEDTLSEAQQARLREALTKKALEHLDSRERKVITDRILCENPRTLRELGEELAISRERVRQLETRALGKIRRIWSQLSSAEAPEGFNIAAVAGIAGIAGIEPGHEARTATIEPMHIQAAA